MNKRLYLGLACCVLVLVTERLCHRATSGFQISKIHGDLSPYLTPQTTTLSTESREYLHTLLSQPFTFLSSGGQSYAFLSQDKKVVLKLFKMHHIQGWSWIYSFPLPGTLDLLRLHSLSTQKKKVDHFLTSTLLAMNSLKEETGLIHLELTPSSSPCSVTLIDKLGIAYPLILNQIPFALQHYAPNPFKELKSHVAKREFQAAQMIVKEIVNTLITRHQKGIGDKDPALRRNLGLLNGRVICIDIGSFFPEPDSPLPIEEQLWKETRRMDRWLSKRSPELKTYLNTLIKTAPSILEKDPQPLLPTSRQPLQPRSTPPGD